MSLHLVRKIGPEDSIKTVTTQFCLFHLFLVIVFYYYDMDAGKLTAILFYFVLVEKKINVFRFWGCSKMVTALPLQGRYLRVRVSSPPH